MQRSSRVTFLALVLAQAAHAIEEYWFRLYDVFPPARAVSEALGFEPALGFAVANGLLVGFGLFCWFAWVQAGRRPARALAWAWAIIETLNGIAHFALAALAGGYFPGLVTAPLLLGIAVGLGVQLACAPRASRLEYRT